MRILSIEFSNDELLGNLILDLSDLNSKSLDTIIFAGENGCGKTSILEALYKFSELQLVSDNDHSNKSITVTYQIPCEQLAQIASHLNGTASNIKYAVDGIISIKKDFSITDYNYSQYIVQFKYSTEQGEKTFFLRFLKYLEIMI